MTLPGLSLVTAIALLGAIGDVTRFKTPRRLVAYLGLDPRVASPATSRPSTARSASKAPAMSAACSSKRPGTRRAAPVRCAPLPTHRYTTRLEVATVATARKTVAIVRHRPSRGENDAFARPRRCAIRSAASSRCSARRATRDARRPTRAPKDPPTPSRTRRRRTSRAGVSPAGRRLAKLTTKGGRGRDTGARISKALEGQSRAADSVKPQGLRFASSVTRAQNRVSHRGAPASSQLDFHP